MRAHVDKQYEAELAHVRDSLVRMGAKVETFLSDAIRALETRDGELAARVISRDRELNELEMDVDDMCVAILAKHHPVASDLRFVTTCLKIVVDLERMGDECVNICERAIELLEEPPLRPYAELRHMGVATQSMVRDALDAFVDADVDRARWVIERDADVDGAYKLLFRSLLDSMRENPDNVIRATRIQSVAKYIERVADHATNIAEMVVFMVRGEDIRHAWQRAGKADLESKRSMAIAPRVPIKDEP